LRDLEIVKINDITKELQPIRTVAAVGSTLPSTELRPSHFHRSSSP
jgi:hypothetical protein